MSSALRVNSVMLVTDAGKNAQSVTADFKTASSSSPLMHIEGLLEALTVADKDGRIVVDRQGDSLRLWRGAARSFLEVV